MKLSKDNQTIRMQVWVEAWTKVAQASNTRHVRIATEWADECLDQFDKRFINKEQQDE